MSCNNCPRKSNQTCGGLYFTGENYTQCSQFSCQYTEQELWECIKSGKGLPKIEEVSE
ncbi:MAG: hypothetical protein MJ225_04830 [Bacilli bacterium]|nr:hypothetical protein [Bacilli bacterium]